MNIQTLHPRELRVSVSCAAAVPAPIGASISRETSGWLHESRLCQCACQCRCLLAEFLEDTSGIMMPEPGPDGSPMIRIIIRSAGSSLRTSALRPLAPTREPHVTAHRAALTTWPRSHGEPPAAHSCTAAELAVSIAEGSCQSEPVGRRKEPEGPFRAGVTACTGAVCHWQSWRVGRGGG
jgi:hypothetical protein